MNWDNIWKNSLIIIAVILILILIGGIIFAFRSENFAYVPYAVVIMGIIAFFGILKAEGTKGIEEFRMRKAITVAIVVVYLGLLPTLAFQGILQFQVTNTTTEVTNQTLNITANNTVPTVPQVPAVPQNVSLSETVVSSFTALVAAVILFYFGSRTLEAYYNRDKGAQPPTTQNPEVQQPQPPEPQQPPEPVDPTKTKKVTTTEVTKEGNKETTVVTEEIKKVDC